MAGKKITEFQNTTGKRGKSHPERSIQADILLVSGCQDNQTSADVMNIKEAFDAVSKGPGGACTNALLEALRGGENTPIKDMLNNMRKILHRKGFTQIPNLSTSQDVDLTKRSFNVIQPNGSGRTRALLIGINYRGTPEQLNGCHSDVEQMKMYLISKRFSSKKEDMRIMIDDKKDYTNQPTYTNIINGLEWLASGAAKGDSLFLHFSGHGGSIPDDNGDEEDGMDETLYPIDHAKMGQLSDDILHAKLCSILPAGVQLLSCFDCCHSGTVLDLPHTFVASKQGCMFTPEEKRARRAEAARLVAEVLEKLAILTVVVGIAVFKIKGPK